MSNLPLPNELKTINPYLLRAKELASKAPYVSYYTKAYAAQVAVQIYQQITKGNANQTEYKPLTNFLMSLMDELEQEKKQLNPNPEEGKGIVELYALKMFSKADSAYRAGRKDQIVGKLFYASSIIIETTKQFSELSDDLKEKQKYARTKAAEIFKTAPAVQSLNVSQNQENEEENEEKSEFSSPQQQNQMPKFGQNYQQNQEIEQEFDIDKQFKSLESKFQKMEEKSPKNSIFIPPSQPYQQYPLQPQQRQQPQIQPRPQFEVAQLEREQIELVKQHTALTMKRQELLQQQQSLIQQTQQNLQRNPQISDNSQHNQPNSGQINQNFNQPAQAFGQNSQAPSFVAKKFAEKMEIDDSSVIHDPNDKSGGVPLDKIFEAEKIVKQAQSALSFVDVPTAREKLRKALELLQ